MSCRCVRWQSMLRRFWSRYAETSTRVVISASGRPNPSSSSESPASDASPAAAASSPSSSLALGAGCQVRPSRRTSPPSALAPRRPRRSADRRPDSRERGVRVARDPRRVDMVGMPVVAVLVELTIAADRAGGRSRPAGPSRARCRPSRRSRDGRWHRSPSFPSRDTRAGGGGSPRPRGVDRAGQLGGADLGQPRPRLLRIEGRIVDLSLGAIGARHEVDPDALGHQPRHPAAGRHTRRRDARGRTARHDQAASATSPTNAERDQSVALADGRGLVHMPTAARSSSPIAGRSAGPAPPRRPGPPSVLRAARGNAGP